MCRILFIVLLSFVFQRVYSQPETFIWHFGVSCVIDFNSGTPQGFSGQSFTGLSANEGTASICDENGELLFYSSGWEVFNKNNEFMPAFANWPPASIGIPLLGGGLSASHSAGIVKVPGSSSQYYLFGVAEEVGFNGLSQQLGLSGVNYVMVDMNLDNGLGDLTTPTIPLNTNMTEKMAFTRHCNGEDTWLVCHEFNTNRFFSYLITENGISDPVISETGFVHDCPIGQMKISLQGDKIAYATYGFFSLVGESVVEVLSFDNATGVVGNSLFLDDTLPNDPVINASGTYGVGFSPDGTKLYASLVNEYNLGTNSVLYQYDLNLPPDNIVEQRFQLADIAAYSGGFQVGPDCRLYFTYGTNYIGVINNPNAPGAACDFDLEGLFLGDGAFSGLAFPTFDDSFFLNGCSEPLVITTDVECPGDISTFELVGEIASENVSWTITQGQQEIASLLGNPVSYIFEYGGSYSLNAFVDEGCIQREETVEFIVTAAQIPIIQISYPDSVCSNVPSLIPTFGTEHSFGGTFESSQLLMDEDSGVISDFFISNGIATISYQTQLGDCFAPIEQLFELYVADCDSVEVLAVPEECGPFIPNAFTPNGDGLNDIFSVEGCLLEGFNIKVFDRWGNIIFQSRADQQGWQGNIAGGEYFAPDGVYSWVLEAPSQGQKKFGHVALIR